MTAATVSPVDTIDTKVRVGCTHLADGVLVQLSGELTGEDLPELRLALLSPFADECRDVVVDAGAVEDATDSALAVLVASMDWAKANGRRFLLSTVSANLEMLLAAAEIEAPRLLALHS